MKTVVRLTTAALAATFAISSTAHAQIQFYTQGFFTSPAGTCNQVAPAPGAPTGASCSGGGFTLNYTAVDYRSGASGPVASNSVISLGGFNLTGSGNVTVPPNTVNFTLWIRQQTPTAGSGFTDGYITGTVVTSADGNSSSLVWAPDQVVNIDATTYSMIFDNTGPAANVGYAIPINETRGINALVTTSVPEPGTFLLVASGLAGLATVARRRRTQL